MNTPKGFHLTILVLLTLTLLLSACAPAAREPLAVVMTVEVPKEVIIEAPAAAPDKPPSAPQATAYVSEFGVAYQPATGPGGIRLIIKNAEVKLLVADTDIAIDRLTQVVADVGGYIIS